MERKNLSKFCIKHYFVLNGGEVTEELHWNETSCDQVFSKRKQVGRCRYSALIEFYHGTVGVGRFVALDKQNEKYGIFTHINW